MPARIVLHPGFHKTGTSTVQAFLRENRKALAPHVALRLRWHLRDVLAAARGYSTDRDPLTLIKFQARFGALMNDIPYMPRRTLILSAEELLGHLPGRGGIADYGAAPVLLYACCEIAQARFPQSEILIYLSTRAPAEWLASAHWEHVKSSAMTLPLDVFSARFERAAALDDMADEIASRVPVPVHRAALEAASLLPLGPADPLIALCDLPDDLRGRLTPVAPVNTRMDDTVRAALIEANRRHRAPAARNAAKRAILAEAAQP